MFATSIVSTKNEHTFNNNAAQLNGTWRALHEKKGVELEKGDLYMRHLNMAHFKLKK